MSKYPDKRGVVKNLIFEMTAGGNPSEKYWHQKIKTTNRGENGDDILAKELFLLIAKIGAQRIAN